MDDEITGGGSAGNESRTAAVVYNTDKDFYKGMGGELRFKAEGLFKKAREKGISIEEIDVQKLREGQVEFPGVGAIDLPAFFVKVRGRHLQSGQVMADGKQIDYYNIYQHYVADKISKKNILKDEKGRIIKENNRPVIKSEPEFLLNDWELFEIGKNIIDDKEFGIEKTITGACDRIIRKLMGENDWLYPGEARMLDEEFDSVQSKIHEDQEKQENNRTISAAPIKRATERQINYLKAKIKNFGVDPDDESVMKEILKQSGFEAVEMSNLSTGDMSRIIDSVNIIIPRIKESLIKRRSVGPFNHGGASEPGDNIRQ